MESGRPTHARGDRRGSLGGGRRVQGARHRQRDRRDPPLRDGLPQRRGRRIRRVVQPGGSFTDRRLPHGYAPFGIQNVNGTLYVTFARQDKARHDDVPGKGRGFVDAFDTSGTLLRRVASRGQLNSPWGVALAPPTFGAFANDLLIGNFGDGRITAFDPLSVRRNGEMQPKGQLRAADCSTLSIDGLWALQFGNGTGSGSKDTLYFTAGPDGETHGLLGTLVPAAAPTNCSGHDDEGDDDQGGDDD